MTSERIYQADDENWFFAIRGSQSMGPFISYVDAEHALDLHVQTCQHRISGTFHWPRSWHHLRSLRRSAPRHT